MIEFALIAMIMFAASLIQGMAGFGSALVSMSLLTFFLSIKTATPLVLMSGVFVNVVIFIRLKQRFRFIKLFPLLIGSVLGIPFGIYGLILLPEAVIKSVLAVIIAFYALFSLLYSNHSFNIKNWWGYFFGFLSGMLGSAFSSNGPPAVMYATLKDWEKRDVMVTLQAYFVISGVIIMAAHGINGLITFEVFRYWLFIIPVQLLGVFLGMNIFNRINQVAFRRIIYILLIILSLNLFVGTLLS